MYRQSPTELKSTISTMKVILLFALFGLSFCQDACPGNSVSNPDAPNCLIIAVEELSYFFPALGEFACAYIKYQEDKNVDNYRKALEKLVFVLKCIGCHADNIFGKDHAIEELLEGVGETGSKSGEAVVKLLNSLGLDEAALKIVCALGEKLLKSECLQKALGNIAPDVLKDLIALYCKLKGSGAADSDAAAADAAAGLTKLMGKLGCALAEVLGLENDADLEKTIGSLSKEYLQALVENLLKLTGKVDLTSKTLCTVLNPVIGK